MHRYELCGTRQRFSCVEYFRHTNVLQLRTHTHTNERTHMRAKHNSNSLNCIVWNCAHVCGLRVVCCCFSIFLFTVFFYIPINTHKYLLNVWFHVFVWLYCLSFLFLYVHFSRLFSMDASARALFWNAFKLYKHTFFSLWFSSKRASKLWSNKRKIIIIESIPSRGI